MSAFDPKRTSAGITSTDLGKLHYYYVGPGILAQLAAPALIIVTLAGGRSHSPGASRPAVPCY